MWNRDSDGVRPVRPADTDPAGAPFGSRNLSLRLGRPFWTTMPTHDLVSAQAAACRDRPRMPWAAAGWRPGRGLDGKPAWPGHNALASPRARQGWNEPRRGRPLWRKPGNSRPIAPRRQEPTPNCRAPWDGSHRSPGLDAASVGLNEVSPLEVIVSQVAQQAGVLGIGLQCLVELGERADTVALSVVQHRQVVRDGFQARIVAPGLLVEQMACSACPLFCSSSAVDQARECLFLGGSSPGGCMEAVDSLSEDVVSESVFKGENPGLVQPIQAVKLTGRATGIDICRWRSWWQVHLGAIRSKSVASRLAGQKMPDADADAGPPVPAVDSPPVVELVAPPSIGPVPCCPPLVLPSMPPATPGASWP